MVSSYTCLTALFIILLTVSVFPQWEAGGSLNFKNEIPERGFGFHVSRYLPFQWPTIGFKLRFGVDLYRDTEEQIRNSIEIQKKFLSEDYHISLISTFFFKNINPYIGLSSGVGHYDVNQFDEYIFFIGVLTGLKFPLTDFLHPYLEISSLKYFSGFDKARIQREISSFQFKWVVGLLFRFDTVKN